jgi:type II secretory pathway pseudopilin PulG
MNAKSKTSERRRGEKDHGFTLVELLALVVIVSLLAVTILPGFAMARSDNRSLQCLNNLRQSTAAWRMFAEDNRDALVASQGVSGRVNWMTGWLDFNPTNQSNWNPEVDIVKSPLWPYCGRSTNLFSCPSDPTRVQALVDGELRRVPRVRTISMSQVFGQGEWLNKTQSFNQTVWRTYAKAGEIVAPTRTFVFLDEHPDSVNDAAFANACTGAQPNDPPSSATIIDWPANHHRLGACGISFADGRAEIHEWLGATIRRAPYGSGIFINFPATDSAVDMQWLAANTTVKR